MSRASLHLTRALLASCLLPSLALAVGEGQGGFPNWEERVLHEWMNRARCDPQIEMQKCGAACSEAACYKPQPPLAWDLHLNRAARFHSDESAAQMYPGLSHDSLCTLVADIDQKYPAACNGAATCACVGGMRTCSPTCTAWSSRVGLFGSSPAGEIIASPQDPDGAFYLWLFEPFMGTACAFSFGPPTNGHRWNILMSGPAVGAGVGMGPSVGDFGGSGAMGKIASAAHYPRTGSVEVWASWADTAAPSDAQVDVDGTCTTLTRKRGSDTNGAWSATVDAGPGCHRYVVSFRDAGGQVVTWPTTGSVGMGPVGCADWDAARPPACGALPPVDAGAPLTDAAMQQGRDAAMQHRDGGAPAARDSGDAPLGSSLMGGCSCAVAPSPSSDHGRWSLVLALGTLALLRRTRRRRPR